MTVSAYTPNYRFNLIDFNSQTWSDDEQNNWKLLDALLQRQYGTIPFAVATGSANTVVLNYTPDVPVVSGQTYSWQAIATNTGGMTVAIDGGAAIALTYLGGVVPANAIQLGDMVQMVYTGTVFAITQPIRQFPSLLLKEGNSGATASANADNLVIESNVSSGMSIMAPALATTRINFNTPSGVAASIAFNGVTTRFEYTVAGGSFLFNQDAQFPGVYASTGFFGNVTGNLVGNVTGNVTGNVSGTAANVTGTVAVAKGGTGVTDVPSIKTLLGLNALAYLSTVNNAQWSGTALALANGGTGASTASTAFAAIAAAGGTVGADMTRSGKGVYIYHDASALASGRIIIQAVGTAPTMANGDILLEY